MGYTTAFVRLRTLSLSSDRLTASLLVGTAPLSSLDWTVLSPCQNLKTINIAYDSRTAWDKDQDVVQSICNILSIIDGTHVQQITLEIRLCHNLVRSTGPLELRTDKDKRLDHWDEFEEALRTYLALKKLTIHISTGLITDDMTQLLFLSEDQMACVRATFEQELKEWVECGKVRVVVSIVSWSCFSCQIVRYADPQRNLL